jgi:hypothetical protein
MEEQKQNCQEITKLKSENKKSYEEIKKREREIRQFKYILEKNNKKIQSLCSHNWITETQMYERTVSCSICGLVDWEKSKT